MPWPFRRHRSQQADAPSVSAAAPAPVTIDDLSGRRRLTVHVGGWQHVEPLTPAATGAAAPVVGSSASFIAGLAGTQPLVSSATLREVSSEAPRGVTQGLARPLPAEPFPPAPEESGGGQASAEQFAPQEATRRPVVASGAPAHPDLTSYAGALVPAEPEPAVFVDPDLALFDDDVPEELPPPIFTTLLAERTGRDLAELRPDLAGTEGDSGDDEADDTSGEATTAEALPGRVAPARSRTAVAHRAVRRRKRGAHRRRRAHEGRGSGDPSRRPNRQRLPNRPIASSRTTGVPRFRIGCAPT